LRIVWRAKSRKSKAVAQYLKLKEKVLSFELWFFAFSFKFLVGKLTNNLTNQKEKI